ERGRDQFDFAVGARRGRDADGFVHRDGHDEPSVVIGVIAKQLQPARRPGHVRRRVSEMLLEESFDRRGVQRNSTQISKSEARNKLKIRILKFSKPGGLGALEY